MRSNVVVSEDDTGGFYIRIVELQRNLLSSQEIMKAHKWERTWE